MSSDELASEVLLILSRSYAPSGNGSMQESGQEQLANERHLERVYDECKCQYGVQHNTTLLVFLQLFDVWIGLYRLDKCDAELTLLIPVVRADVQLTQRFAFKLTQSLAFTRWKQSRFQDAIELFIQLENTLKIEAKAASPALMENMAHTFSALGDYCKAEIYFEQCISLKSENEGGVLLGLGILKDRLGMPDEGLEKCLAAWNWYRERFSEKGHISSLEAKCSLTISKLYLAKRDFENAYFHADQAVATFVITTGADSPLVASALKVKGDVLWTLSNDREDAQRAFLEAFSIESKKDAIDLMTLIELSQRLKDTVIAAMPSDPNAKPVVVRNKFSPILSLALQSCEQARNKLPADGNLGAYFKIISELAIWANQLDIAESLLVEAVSLFQGEQSMDCSCLIQQCTEIIALLSTSKGHS
jgi:tetratricopeptide (TPR) repeat protein